MKKKGLIIATIVMVLVLAVSLTTATYAWFSSSAKTTVDKMELNVKAANAVAIGAHKNLNSNTQDDYIYSSITLGYDSTDNNIPQYTGDTPGLGTELTFGSASGTSLTLSKAVATAPTVTAGSTPANIDSSFTPSNKIFAASSGNTDTTIDPTSVAIAKANTDFICLKMGAQAAQTGVKGIYATVTVTTTDTATTLKMMAAMHFYIKTTQYSVVESVRTATGTKVVEFDLFGTKNSNNSAKKTVGASTPTDQQSTVTGVTLRKATDSDQAQAIFSFPIGGVESKAAAIAEPAPADLKTDGSEIFEFEIYAYVDGLDSHCISTAAGCSAAFDIEFFGITATSTDVPTTWIALASV